MQPDTRHFFRVTAGVAICQVRVDVYPDGGFARLRVYGELSAAGRAALGVRWFDLLPPGQAATVLAAECGLPGDVADALAAARPVQDAAGLAAALHAAGARDEQAAAVRALVLG